jgi:hypothetical protein
MWAIIALLVMAAVVHWVIPKFGTRWVMKAKWNACIVAVFTSASLVQTRNKLPNKALAFASDLAGRAA